MSDKFSNNVKCPICDNVIGFIHENMLEEKILARHLVREHENFIMYLIRLYEKSEDDFGYLMSCIENEREDFLTEIWYNS